MLLDNAIPNLLMNFELIRTGRCSGYKSSAATLSLLTANVRLTCAEKKFDLAAAMTL